MIVETVIDTDSLGFRMAVAMRCTALAFQDLRAAWDASARREAAERDARRRAFNRAVVEAVGR